MWNIDELLNKLDIDFTRLHDLLVYDPHAPMIFSSGIFLWLFAAFIVFYLLLQRRTTARLMFVTLFSYYFYYKSSGTYFFLLAIVTVSDFFIARLMERATVRWQRKTWVAVSLLINLGLLCYFKYTNFLCGFFASLTGGTFTAMDIFLPVGISFFTFQSLSYTIDVYRKEITPLTNLLDYAFYVSFFPQLVAGPIVRARDFIPQIRRPLFVSKEMFGKGIFLIVSGLFKKAVISDYISINFVERIFDNPTLYSGVENLMGVYGYALQIYCDFSGYSDMAIGIALLLGFHFNMNFDSPYKSASITEFWRRWHISLSSWLRDYLYISLGGNRKGKIRQYANLIITMFLGGLWHGASWNFVFGGCCMVLRWQPISSGWASPAGKGRAQSWHPPLLRHRNHVPLRLFLLDIFPQCRLLHFAGYVEPDIHSFPSPAFHPTGGGLLGSVCLDVARLFPPFRTGQLGTCLLQSCHPASAYRESAVAGCHDLPCNSNEELGDTAVHLFPVLRVILLVPCCEMS